MKKVIVVLISFVFSIHLDAQDEYGMAFSNYSPTKTIFHNPTNVIDNKTYLDIHLIGAGMFVNNNFIYEPGSQFTFINNILLGRSWPDFQFNTKDNLKSGYQDADVQLFSATFQYKEHGFGLTSRIRTIFDFRRIPNSVAKLLTDGTGNYDGFYNQVHSADRMSMNQLSFVEIGGTYSNAFYHFDKDLMVVGGSLKYLIGITGAGIRIDELEYNVVDPSTTRFIRYKGRTGYASGFNSGSGISGDIGFMYKRMVKNVNYYQPFSRNSACECYDYKFKLGASIIDIGYITFKKDAVFHEVETDLTDSQMDGSQLSFDNFGNFVSSEFNSVKSSDKFSFWVPTALNLTADYNLENNFYVSGQYTHGFFRSIGMGVQRPHILNVGGRYETKWFEASLNGSMYNFQEFHTGLGLRFLYLTVGTDNLGSLLGFADFYGTDLYFNLKFFLTQKPGCKRKHKKSNRNATRCVKN